MVFISGISGNRPPLSLYTPWLAAPVMRRTRCSKEEWERVIYLLGFEIFSVERKLWYCDSSPSSPLAGGQSADVNITSLQSTTEWPPFLLQPWDQHCSWQYDPQLQHQHQQPHQQHRIWSSNSLGRTIESLELVSEWKVEWMRFSVECSVFGWQRIGLNGWGWQLCEANINERKISH